jgi:hypothetical protein
MDNFEYEIDEVYGSYTISGAIQWRKNNGWDLMNIFQEQYFSDSWNGATQKYDQIPMYKYVLVFKRKLP